jgi:tetratricopeptide (TPR) repeat protein
MTNRGSAYVDQVLYLQMLGKDTSENLKLAAEWYNKAIQTRPVHGSAWRKLGNVYVMQAEKALEANQNPSNWIHDAEKAFAKAYEFEPDEYELAGVKARLEVTKARDAANQGKNPRRYFEQADKLFEEALKLNPGATDIILEMARRDYYEASWLLASKKDPNDAVQRGLKHIEESQKDAPDSAAALLLMGKLQLCKRNLAGNAAESFKKALSINSNLHHEIDALIQKAHSMTLVDAPIQ